MDGDLLERFQLAWPDKLRFYHLGELVAETEELGFEALPRQAVGFKIYSLDFQVSLIAAFDDADSDGMIAELGNTIASQLATSMGAKAGESVWISPPYRMKHDSLNLLLKHHTPSAHYRYPLPPSCRGDLHMLLYPIELSKEVADV